MQEEERRGRLEQELGEEVSLAPPLLPLKFGNGLLLQYTVNRPGLDDRLGLLELGLATGLTSLALALVSATSSYVLRSAPLLLAVQERRRRALARLLKATNRVVGVVQVLLLLLLFLYTVSHYSAADFEDHQSEHFVKKRIFMFSMIVSCTMFVSILVAAAVVGFIYCKQRGRREDQEGRQGAREAAMVPPARSLLPLGLANALLGLYIGVPGEDAAVVGPAVYLLDLCLYLATATILITVLEAVARVALLAAMMDGLLDAEEERMVRVLHLARYAMALGQFAMFAVMFGHCVEVFAMTGAEEFLCPRNLLLICSLLSSAVLAAGLAAAALCLHLAA